MGQRIIIGQDDIPAKLNTQQLSAAIAAAAGVLTSEVAVSYFGPGTEEVWLKDGSVESRDTAPSLVVHAPDGASRIAVLNAVAAHAPDKDEGEEATAAKTLRQRAELREYMLQFLQDPELLAMLKAALRG